MSGRVIQGFFAGGQPPLSLQALSPQTAAPGPAATAGAPRPHAPPGIAPAGGASAQRRPAGAPIHTPSHPRQATPQQSQPLQAHGTARSFAVDPQQIGLVRSGGKPLPPSILAKMEAAFGTDFSAVRIHEGPQAARIGALAFTTGTDIYFAPGRYQPETLQGQQLLGHELTHVVQQRQGRVRAPSGSGLSIVQDAMLEAEADRMGMRAAMESNAVSTVAPQRPNTVRRPAAILCRGFYGDQEINQFVLNNPIGVAETNGEYAGRLTREFRTSHQYAIRGDYETLRRLAWNVNVNDHKPSPDTVNHVRQLAADFNDHVLGNVAGVGWHSETVHRRGDANNTWNYVYGGSISARKETYHASAVFINGQAKAGNDGRSTFFPLTMSIDDIRAEALYVANVYPLVGQVRRGRGPKSGIVIDCLINNNTIVSAYPYKPGW